MNPYGMSREEWVMGNPTVIDYNHQPSQPGPGPQPLQSAPVTSYPMKYDPFVEDNLEMEISVDEKSLKKTTQSPVKKPERPMQVKEHVEVRSGAAFYRGLILFIPPFEQLASPAKGSPAMKMLYASFEFSFKRPIKIETKHRDGTNVMEATVMYDDQIICSGSGWAPHIDASVRALELLSETCFIVQAKEDYFTKCKLVNAENMKTLNLKRWEALSEKHPKLSELTKDSHIQKTFAVFLDGHTSSGSYEDVVCCNLTRQDVNHIKSVVEFFQLTMLPCSISTNLSKKETPCVVSIHKYTSAQRLLDILIENGGENDNFRVYPPETFKDFYKLHPNYWDPKSTVTRDEFKSTLDDEEIQAAILKPYENTICDLFKIFKALPKRMKDSDEPKQEKYDDDDNMMDTLKLDMANSKNVAPVERMQLLLKYMEQLQDYGSRVLTSGRPEKIKIYHNAIDNLRKDLETCRKDIEKDQKDNVSGKTSVATRSAARSPPRRRKSPPRRRTPPRRRSKSPVKRSMRKSPSPHRRSPKRGERRRSHSPRRRMPDRAWSPRRVPFRRSPPRKVRSPTQRSIQPSSINQDNPVFTIFKERFSKFVDILRRFRIEIEDTPLDRRVTLREVFLRIQSQFDNFHKEISENLPVLGHYVDEMAICREELAEQLQMIAAGDQLRATAPLSYPIHQYRTPYPPQPAPPPPSFTYPF